MRQAIFFSIAAHFALMALIAIYPLFLSNKMIDPNKVYRVSLVDLPGGLGKTTLTSAKGRHVQRQATAKSERNPKQQAPKQAKAKKPTKASKVEPVMKAPAKVQKKTRPEKTVAQKEQKTAKAEEAKRDAAQQPARTQEPENNQAAQASAQPGVLKVAKSAVNIEGAPAGGSLSFDVSIFPYPYYIRIIQTRVSENWLFKDVEVLSGQVDKAVISFRIMRDGTAKDPTVERSSGVGLIDSSAIRAVLASSPFPPLPSDFKEDSLNVYIGFEYIRNG